MTLQYALTLSAAAFCCLACNSDPVKTGPQTTTKTPTTPRHFEKFTIDEVKKQSGKIVVEGSTDLPDGARLIVSIENKTKKETDRVYPSEGDAFVRNGKWKTELNIISAPEFKPDPHVASAVWTPISEKPEIIALTGENGENLRGPRVELFHGNVKLFSLEKDVRLDLGKASPDSLPNPRSYPEGSPERAVAESLRDWHNCNWKDMARKAYRLDDDSLSDRIEACKNHFSFEKLHSAKILSIDKSSDPYFNLPGNIARVIVHVEKTNGAELEGEDMQWVVLRLGQNHEPDRHGRWGVNIDAVGSK